MQKETIGSLFELFKISIKKMCTARVLLPLALFTLVVTNIIPFFVEMVVTAVAPSLDEETFFTIKNISIFSIYIIGFIAYFLLIYLVYFAGVTYFVSTEKHKLKTDVKNIFSLVGKRWKKFISTQVFMMVFLLLAISFCFVLSFMSTALSIAAAFMVFLYFMMRFYVAMYAPIYDGFGPIKSLKTSAEIMDGIKTKVLVFIFLLMLIYMVGSLLVFAPVGALLYFSFSYEYLAFLADAPVTEETMASITSIDFLFREVLRFLNSFITNLLVAISSAVPALLYLKRRDMAVSTN